MCTLIDSRLLDWKHVTHEVVYAHKLLGAGRLLLCYVHSLCVTRYCTALMMHDPNMHLSFVLSQGSYISLLYTWCSMSFSTSYNHSGHYMVGQRASLFIAHQCRTEASNAFVSMCCVYVIQALCTEASLHALRRQYPQIYSTTHKLLIDPASVMVTRTDFLAAFKATTPSSHRSAVAHARCAHALCLSKLIVFARLDEHVLCSSSQSVRSFVFAQKQEQRLQSLQMQMGGSVVSQ